MGPRHDFCATNRVEYSPNEGFKLNGSRVSVLVGSNYVRIGCYSISIYALKRIVEHAAPLLYPQVSTEKEIS